MKSTTLGIGLLVGGLLAAPAALRAEDAAPAPEKAITLQTICPVMGGTINRDLYVDHDGRRVYICCKGCEVSLKKDPATYIKKLEDAGITVARLQTVCPVMGGAIDKALYVDHDGKRIYVCCARCIAKIKEDPRATITKMEAAGVALYPAGEVGKAAEPKKADASHEGHRR